MVSKIIKFFLVFNAFLTIPLCGYFVLHHDFMETHGDCLSSVVENCSSDNIVHCDSHEHKCSSCTSEKDKSRIVKKLRIGRFANKEQSFASTKNIISNTKLSVSLKRLTHPERLARLKNKQFIPLLT